VIGDPVLSEQEVMHQSGVGKKAFYVLLLLIDKGQQLSFLQKEKIILSA
jgi:hypothetical protein